MTPQTLSILAPTRYPWRFNGPRHSRHKVETRDFLPLNRVSNRIEGVTVLNPWPPRRFDLVHAFNRIPLGRTPFVIGFESHLPRGFGTEGTLWWRWMCDMLASDRCRGIVAISRFAQDMFLSQHAGNVALHDVLAAKLHLRYPNLPLAEIPADMERGEEAGLRLVFVGNHFARKGGCVAVVMAELARARGVALHVDIVSTLEMGSGIWTDPTDATAFAPYVALLDQPNVRLHRGLANTEVLALLRRADVSLLATFGDTFGYSALESLANHTPVIATKQGALPEIITDGETGFLLDLPTIRGEWVHLAAPDRGSAAFVSMWHGEIRRLAQQALDALVAAATTPGRLAGMRRAAGLSARRFAPEPANLWWDAFYDEACLHVVRRSAGNAGYDTLTGEGRLRPG